MIFKGGEVFFEDSFRFMDFSVSDGIIYKGTAGKAVKDCKDLIIIPGLTDIHTHGCIGFDFGSADKDEMEKMGDFYIKSGVTSLLPTLVALNIDDYQAQLENILFCAERGSPFCGVNLEGPFLAKAKKGAMNEKNIIDIDIAKAKRLWEYSKGTIRLMTVSPELSGFSELISFAKNKFFISLGHTECDAEKAHKAFALGALHITHLFNAMNPLHHRSPSLLGAALASKCTKEIICDGIHLDKDICLMLFKGFSNELAMISDSMAATGLNDGQYSLGGLDVFVKNGKAQLKDGTIAGSCKTLFDDLRYALSLGIEREEAVRSVTSIPARSADLSCGVLKENAKADFLILDRSFNLLEVYKNGQRVLP